MSAEGKKAMLVPGYPSGELPVWKGGGSYCMSPVCMRRPHARACVCCLCYVEVQVISTMSKAETELVLVKAETTLIAGASKNNKTRWP